MITTQSKAERAAFPIAAAHPGDRSTDVASSEDLAVRKRSACDARQIEDLARDDAEP
jgi:hypothetical protein